MSVIKSIIDHLMDASDEQPPWMDVKEIADLSMLDTARSGLRGVTLFVFLQSESPSPDVRGSGPYLQELTQTYGVLVVAKLVNQDTFDFEPIRKQLRKRLFGWSPYSGYESFWLGSGQLFNLQRGQISWLDNFVTEYTEDQNRYGS